MSGHTLVLTRHFACPPEVLFDAWTDPAQLPQWFGPMGFDCETKYIDLREGGEWVFDMVSPDYGRFANRHRFVTLSRPSLIVFEMDGLDGADPKRVEVAMEVYAGGTRMVYTMTFPNADELAAAQAINAVELGYSTLGKLAVHVSAL